MNGLKRLSGAKEVSQDDFSGGVATFLVSFEAPPAVKMADIQKGVGKYKLDQVKMKLTTMAPEGNKVGALTLANPKDEDLLKEAQGLKGKKVVLSGVLSEDNAGAQTLTLSKVAEVK